MKLAREELPQDPLALFDRWYVEATREACEPEAMTLATVDASGAPDLRTVLMRGVVRESGREGFVFYTNTTSAKGRALEHEPRCALLFYWGDLGGQGGQCAFGGRQVRVRGHAERVPDEQSDAYFAKRPRLSQLGAWASPQSEVIGDETLQAMLGALSVRFDGQPVPRPPYWGGFAVVIETIEFWQSRSGRLHDRFRYARDPAGWRIERLAP